MDIISTRIGNGRAVHRAFRDGDSVITACGAEGGRGGSARTLPREADAPVTCRRCGGSAGMATVFIEARHRAYRPSEPARTPYHPYASRRDWLLGRAQVLEAEGKTRLAAEARADAEKELTR